METLIRSYYDKCLDSILEDINIITNNRNKYHKDLPAFTRQSLLDNITEAKSRIKREVARGLHIEDKKILYALITEAQAMTSLELPPI